MYSADTNVGLLTNQSNGKYKPADPEFQAIELQDMDDNGYVAFDDSKQQCNYASLPQNPILQDPNPQQSAPKPIQQQQQAQAPPKQLQQQVPQAQQNQQIQQNYGQWERTYTNQPLIQQQQMPQCFATCLHCRTNQAVQNPQQPFMCYKCRQVTQPKFNCFLCGSCQAKVMYQMNVSNIIKCTRCMTINYVPDGPQQNVPKQQIPSQPQPQPQQNQPYQPQPQQLPQQNTSQASEQSKIPKNYHSENEKFFQYIENFYKQYLFKIYKSTSYSEIDLEQLILAMKKFKLINELFKIVKISDLKELFRHSVLHHIDVNEIFNHQSYSINSFYFIVKGIAQTVWVKSELETEEFDIQQIPNWQITQDPTSLDEIIAYAVNQLLVRQGTRNLRDLASLLMDKLSKKKSEEWERISNWNKAKNQINPKCKLYLIQGDFLTSQLQHKNIQLLGPLIAREDLYIIELTGDDYQQFVAHIQLRARNSEIRKLRKCALFKDLTLFRREKIFSNMHIQQYQRGYILFQEGQHQEYLYLIRSGEVELLHKLYDEKNKKHYLQINKLISKNQIIGELNGHTYKFTAKISSAKCVLFQIKRHLYFQIAAEMCQKKEEQHNEIEQFRLPSLFENIQNALAKPVQDVEYEVKEYDKKLTYLYPIVKDQHIIERTHLDQSQQDIHKYRLFNFSKSVQIYRRFENENKYKKIDFDQPLLKALEISNEKVMFLKSLHQQYTIRRPPNNHPIKELSNHKEKMKNIQGVVTEKKYSSILNFTKRNKSLI